MNIFSTIKKSVIALDTVTHPSGSYVWSANSSTLVDTDSSDTLRIKLSEVVDPHLKLGPEPIRIIKAVRANGATTFYLDRPIEFGGHSSVLDIFGIEKRMTLLEKAILDGSSVSFAETVALNELLNLNVQYELYNGNLYVPYSADPIVLNLELPVRIYDVTGLSHLGFAQKTGDINTFASYFSDTPVVRTKFSSAEFFIKTGSSTKYYPAMIDYEQEILSEPGKIKFDLSNVDQINDTVRVVFKFTNELVVQS